MATDVAQPEAELLRLVIVTLYHEVVAEMKKVTWPGPSVRFDRLVDRASSCYRCSSVS